MRLRHPRRTRPRSRSVGASIGRREVRAGAAEADAVFAGLDVYRPETRGECAGGDRPCPWAGCKHHLYLDVNPETGSVKLNFPDVPPDEMWRLRETCSLDVADRGGITLEQVGEIQNLTREAIRLVEKRALVKLKLEVDESGKLE